MPFRSRSILWSLLGWTEVFAYTILTQAESSPGLCSIPITALLVTLVAFVALVHKESQEMKSWIVFALWGAVIAVVLLLRTWSLVDNTFLYLYIAVTGLLTSIVWCIVSHALRITESAWHWYVWALILVIAMGGAFNNQAGLSEKYYMVPVVVLIVVQTVYIWRTIHDQPPGSVRCRHLWRIVSGTVLSFTLLCTGILHQTNVISTVQWEATIIVVEILLGMSVVVDAVIGFRQQPINYLPVEVDQNAL